MHPSLALGWPNFIKPSAPIINSSYSYFHDIMTVMSKFIFYNTNTRSRTYLLTFIFLSLFISACSHGNKSDNVHPTDSDIHKKSPAEVFHADNDIAMMLRSVTDALSQGEELDSIDYNYEGVLTDGMGHPLYTDIDGTPGAWEIKVISPDTLSISNLYLGDLLPEALESYITQSLGLSAADYLDVPDLNTGENTVTSMYGFNGGVLRFDISTALTPAGQEGPLMTITAISGKR